MCIQQIVHHTSELQNQSDFTKTNNSNVLPAKIPKNKTQLKFIPESPIKIPIPSLPFTDNDQISDKPYNISLITLFFNNIHAPNIKLPIGTYSPNQNLHTEKNKK